MRQARGCASVWWNDAEIVPYDRLPMNLPARAGSTTLPSPPGRRVGDEGRDATTGSWPHFATRTPWRLSFPAQPHPQLPEILGIDAVRQDYSPPDPPAALVFQVHNGKKISHVSAAQNLALDPVAAPGLNAECVIRSDFECNHRIRCAQQYCLPDFEHEIDRESCNRDQLQPQRHARQRNRGDRRAMRDYEYRGQYPGRPQ